MSRTLHSLTLASALALAAPLTAQAQHWSYSGDEGPAHWGEHGGADASCATGQQQSPINITGAIPAFAAGPALDWPDTLAGEVVDNGHTVQVTVTGEAGLDLDGQHYRLVQFHFHAESEHQIEGQNAPMEVHFVHAAEDGSLAVVGVMVEVGGAMPALSGIWAIDPDLHGSGGVAAALRLRDFLPTDPAAFRYAGSLTTPPCSEIVSWTVYAHAVTATQAQIDWFAERHPHSNRPVMPHHRRVLLQTAG